ncbi:MAG: hypothetical protein WDZ62_02500 [Candidatus Pacearchaeota archaeon]
MVQTKHMNENSFAKFLKEFNVAGELVRARQDEKQGLLNEFDQESKRFFFGKISERALASSVKKTNKELKRLDKDIRNNISRSKKVAERAIKLVTDQKPISYRATLSGISGGDKKKKSSKKKVKKRSPVKKMTKRKAKKKSSGKRKTKKK